MNISQQQRKIYTILLLVSLLLHVALLRYISLDSEKGDYERPKLVTIQLKKSMSPPTLPDPVPHTPVPPPPVQKQPEHPEKEVQPDVEPELLVDSYHGEEATSQNQTDTSADQLEYGMTQPGTKLKKQSGKEVIADDGVITTTGPAEAFADLGAKADQAEPSQKGDLSELLSQKSEESSQSEGFLEDSDQLAISDSLKDLEIPEEFLGNLGNMTQLNELDLGNAFVEEPFSKNKGKEVRIVNGYLKRMSEQVRKYWDYEKSLKTPFVGSIIIDLSPYGYLENLKLVQSSGQNEIDEYALLAVKSVKRYAVHPNPDINRRYFSRLFFYFAGNSVEYELMPFEEAKQRKEKS